MSELHISLIQANLVWENPDENLKMFSEKLNAIPAHTDVVILPEMFTTGFSMQPEKFAETELGRSVAWMKEMAAKNDCVITGSLIIKEANSYFNRLFWMQPDGNYKTYDKRHLFSLAGEEKHYSPGKERIIVTWKGFKIMPLVCYDLRFPVWSRNDLDYDLLFYVANWPERRAFYWTQLLIARAIENQAYVIGVNRVGNDGNNIYHSGDSVCLDPLGAKVGTTASGKEDTINVTLSQGSISRVRETFHFLNDKDVFAIDA
tara:strand:- start:9136 stop:9915 length:780 start_codon:yes stop_codon:yes gene_type:complete